MALGHDFKGRRIVIIGACQAPGPLGAQHLAQAGARIVAIDANAAGLQKLTHQCSARIEPLTLTGDVSAALRKVGNAWGKAPLHGVLNLMPLQHPRDINGQIKALTALTRAFARGLVAGNGAMVSIVGTPKEPLDGLALGMGPAIRAVQDATAHELASHGLRINTVIVPQMEATRALAPALSFLCKDARDVTGQMIRVSGSAG